MATEVVQLLSFYIDMSLSQVANMTCFRLSFIVLLCENYLFICQRSVVSSS